MKVKREVWTILIVLVSLITVFSVISYAETAGQEAVNAANTELTQQTPPAAVPPPSTQQVVQQTSTQVLYRYDGNSMKGLNLAAHTPGGESTADKRVSSDSKIYGYVLSPTGYYINGQYSAADPLGSTAHESPSAYNVLSNGGVQYLTAGEKVYFDAYLKANKLTYTPEEVVRTYDSQSPLAGAVGPGPNAGTTQLSTTISLLVRNSDGSLTLNDNYKNELNTVVPGEVIPGSFIPAPAKLSIPGPLSSLLPSAAGQDNNFEPGAVCPTS